MSFEYSITNKRYHTLDYYLKSKYHKKVFKVPLNASFTCPNRDGSKGVGGCVFCSSVGSADISGLDIYKKHLMDQYDEYVKVMENKWPDSYYIVYFQSFTNTYGSIEKLKKTFSCFIGLDNVIGMSIATRPDCINEEICMYLVELKKNFSEFWIELGLQTANNKIGKQINRCYDFSSFDIACKLLKKYGLDVVVHIINGLPNESKDSMYRTIKVINKYHLFGIKFHCLCVLKGSNLEHKNIFSLTREEYINILIEQLQLLNDDTIIHRLVSDASENLLIAPKWVNDKTLFNNELDKEMERLDVFQGDKN